MKSHTFKVISPSNNKIEIKKLYASLEEINNCLQDAKSAEKIWHQIPLVDKKKLINKFIEELKTNQSEIAREISIQIGRPIKYAAKEVDGLIERTNYMLLVAEESLKKIDTSENGIQKFITREPLGTVFVIAPWNYPYLTAINAIVPALLAGNCVILKHASKTPLCAERLYQAFSKAGLPKGVFQYLHLAHKDVSNIINSKQVNFVNFTGSVSSGINIYKNASSNLIDVGLELGGKDAAYIRNDADLDYSVEQIVSGVIFNSGQSCCGIERVYIHKDVFDKAIQKFIDITEKEILGDPLDPKTTLGPMSSLEDANSIREQKSIAINNGAKGIVNENKFPMATNDSAYIAPQFYINVNNSSKLMQEENFGPIAGIIRVDSDLEAISLINDSSFGLTASIWTKDTEEGTKLAQSINTGTVFINKCDYLDPSLAWTGTKNSGLGCTLSKLGFTQFTRAKSFYINKI